MILGSRYLLGSSNARVRFVLRGVSYLARVSIVLDVEPL